MGRYDRPTVVDWVLQLGKSHLIVVEDSLLMMDGKPLLSLIVPAYNEGKRLPQTLPQIIEFVETQAFSSEIIVVDNNSSDDTRQIAEQFAQKHTCIRVFEETRQGKGAAVRAGMLEATGDFLFMADADLSMPIGEVSKFLPPQLDGYDVAIASREVEAQCATMNQLTGISWVASLTSLSRSWPSQASRIRNVGFKCFRRHAALDVLALQSIDGWAFDVELLFIAQQRGYDIVEVPIDWYYRANSRINPISDAFNMFREVLKIRVNGWRGYYNRPESADAGVEPN